MTMSNLSRIALGSLAALVLGVAHAQYQAPAPATPVPESTSPAADSSAIVQTAFKRADLNGDGRLSSDELSQFPALSSRFTDLDKDKDGFVSSSEFSAGVTVKTN